MTIRQNYSRLLTYPLAILLALMVTISIIYLKFPVQGKLGVFVWFLSYIPLVAYSFYCFLTVIVRYLKRDSVLSVLFLLAILTIVFVNVPKPYNFSSTITREIGCTLTHLTNKVDGGFNGSCLWGYPERQFWLPTLPTLVFGRTLAALNLGGSLYFVIGLAVFLAGVMTYIPDKRKSDMVAAFILASLPHFYFVNYFLFYFEQGLNPLSFGLILCGLYLNYRKTKSTFVLLLAGIVLQYLAYAYTPSLALAAISLFVIAWMLVKRQFPKHHAWLAVAVGAATIAAIMTSFVFRNDFHVTSALDPRGQTELISDIHKTAEHILLGNHGTAYTSPLFMILFPAIVLVMISGLMGVPTIGIGLWVLTVLITAVVAHGYLYYSLDYRLLRTVVIIPVIFTTITVWLKRIPLPLPRTAAFVFCIVLFIYGMRYQHLYLSSKETSAQFTTIRQLQSIIKPDGSRVKSPLYLHGDAYADFDSYKDFTVYFIPQLSEIIVDKNILDAFCTFQKKDKGYLIMRLKDNCFQKLRSGGDETMVSLGTIDAPHDGILAVFEVK